MFFGFPRFIVNTDRLLSFRPPMFYIGNRASDDAVSATAGIDTSDRGLCNHLQGEYQLTVRFGLFGSNRYGIPELFGREASFIDDRIDRLQPVVGPQNGIARLVLEIDDVEQILHVGRGFAAGGRALLRFGRNRRHALHTPHAAAAGGGAIFRRSVDLFEDGLQLFESLFDRDRMRIFSSRRVFTGRPRLRARISRTAGQQPKPEK